MEGFKGITLESLAGGAASELFTEAMNRVLDNIQDNNSPAEAKRFIIITVEIKPTSDRRDSADIGLDVAYKLAGLRKAKSFMHMALIGGKAIGSEEKIVQPELPINGEKIVDINSGRKA